MTSHIRTFGPINLGANGTDFYIYFVVPFHLLQKRIVRGTFVNLVPSHNPLLEYRKLSRFCESVKTFNIHRNSWNVGIYKSYQIRNAYARTCIEYRFPRLTTSYNANLAAGRVFLSLEASDKPQLKTLYIYAIEKVLIAPTANFIYFMPHFGC